jgi:hypothetical protein
MKRPYTVANRKGKQVIKQRFVPIVAVVPMRLKEDQQLDSDVFRPKEGRPLLLSEVPT